MTGSVIWITGLSGAGKSTLAEKLTQRLTTGGTSTVRLDGDELREVFGIASGKCESYSREERLALAMRYSHLCRILAQQGITVVIATISLFREVHSWNRLNLPGYFEVYLKVPIEELRRRDPKCIYRRFDAGELNNVAGLDLPIDEPEAADHVVEFISGRSVDELANELITQLTEEI
jgi:cytidine diphosphoramidate kinase